MFQRLLIGGFLVIWAVTVVAGQGPQSSTAPRLGPGQAPRLGSGQAPRLGSGQAASGAATQEKQGAARATLDKYCVGCHNARLKTGGLALDELDLSRLADHAEVAER